MFSFVYRGRTGSLVEYWNFLNEEKMAIATRYITTMKSIEEDSSNKSSSTGSYTIMNEVASLYASLGRFLKDLGLMEEVCRFPSILT